MMLLYFSLLKLSSAFLNFFEKMFKHLPRVLKDSKKADIDLFPYRLFYCVITFSGE